jgi:DNA-binding transcriptional MocR family regulator
MEKKLQFASRIERLEDKSLLIAMEQAIETDDTISFSGGFPSSETYPIEDIKKSFIKVLELDGKNALSYCSTSGFGPLRKIISKRMSQKFGVNYGLDEIIITSGSQQGLDMSAMLFVNKDDIVIFEAPSYLGAVSALRAHEATLVAVETDDEGIKIQELQETLEKYGSKVKMIYVNPDHQNPTGRSWSTARRKAFMELMEKYEIPVLEDAAYSELNFDDELQKPLSFFDKKGQVIYIGTFSKIFCPGLRVAWLCARKEILEKIMILKSSADLSSSAICQMQMAHYLEDFDIDRHINKIVELYRHRRDVMLSAIKKAFPPEVKYTVPNGGLFIWVTLPEGKDTSVLLGRAVENKVTFVPGRAFYPGGTKNNEFRLNYSNVQEDEIMHGISILGKLIKEYLGEKS